MTALRNYLPGFAALMLFDCLAQVCFKYATLDAHPFMADLDWLLRVLASPWLYGAIAGYVCSFLTWMSLLQTAPVGPAFAASHLEVIVVALVSVPLFGETLTPLQCFGALLVVAGVLCLAQEEGRLQSEVGLD
jgi:drug/metabolite transporter (DMT)-like permease